jgi:hypothetical protein
MFSTTKHYNEFSKNYIEVDTNSSEDIKEQNGGDTEKQLYTLPGFEHAIPFLSNYFKTRSTPPFFLL